MDKLGWTFYYIGRLMYYVEKRDAVQAGYLAWQMRGCIGPKWLQPGEPGYFRYIPHISL